MMVLLSSLATMATDYETGQPLKRYLDSSPLPLFLFLNFPRLPTVWLVSPSPSSPATGLAGVVVRTEYECTSLRRNRTWIGL